MKESPRKNEQNNPQPYTLNIDAGTLLLAVSALILLPLLITGFVSH